MIDKFARISAIGGYERDFVSSLKVIVIGAGAIGNELVKNLVLFGIKEVLLFDFDKIELHNLTRSVFFRETDVGDFKAETVAMRAAELSKDTLVRAINKDFWHSLGFETLSEYDAVVCAVDNLEARIKLNTLCGISKKLFINTAIDHRYAGVEIYPYHNGLECGCYECILPSSAYTKIAEKYSCGWIRKIHTENKTIPTTTITTSIVAAHACSHLFEYLNNDLQKPDFDYSQSRKIFCDTKAPSISSVTIGSKKDCVSIIHGKKEISLTSAKRDISRLDKNINIDLISGRPDTRIQFSEPILLFTMNKNGERKMIFDNAEKFDETILLENGKRNLDAEIIEYIGFEELTKFYTDKKIPSKYILLDIEGFDKTIIVEMEND